MIKEKSSFLAAEESGGVGFVPAELNKIMLMLSYSWILFPR
jgi:hypothetical protein